MGVLPANDLVFNLIICTSGKKNVKKRENT